MEYGIESVGQIIYCYIWYISTGTFTRHNILQRYTTGYLRFIIVGLIIEY